MDNRLKNLLAGVAILALLAGSYVMVKYISVYSKSIQAGSYKSFSVTGEGKIVAIPDVAKFSFGVITEGGKDIATLQKDNTTKINKAIEYLKKQGIKDEDITTTGYNVEPRYQYSNCYRDGGVCPPPVIVGYTIRQNVSVKARDFSKVGDLLSGVVESGANDVSQLQFVVEDREKLVTEAKGKAIAQAREKAILLAKEGGFKLGDLIAIDDLGGISPMPYGYGMGGDMAVMEKSIVAPNIEPGSQEIISSVSLRFEIE